MQFTRSYTTADPGAGPYFAAATGLQLRGFRYLPTFLASSNRVEAQVKRAPGLVAYSLRADPFSRRFWTLSIWQSRDAMAAFVPQGAHASAIKSFAKWARQGAAVAEWTACDSRLDWDDALHRLETPTRHT